MPIRFRCTACGHRLSISTSKQGQLTTCPVCRAETTIPWAEETGATEASPDLVAFDDGTFPAQLDIRAPKALPKIDPPELPVDEPDPQEPATPGTNLGAGLGASRGAKSKIPSIALERTKPPRERRRKPIELEEMDLTPMVDVTFLLLIFFMITASFSLQKTIPFPTPDPNRSGGRASLQTLDDLLNTSILVEIDRNGVISIDRTKFDTDPRVLEDEFRLQMLRDRKQEMVVTVDPAAHHRVVITVLDAANAAGLQKIRLATGTGNSSRKVSSRAESPDPDNRKMSAKPTGKNLRDDRIQMTAEHDLTNIRHSFHPLVGEKVA